MGMKKQDSTDIQKGFKMLGELVDFTSTKNDANHIDYTGDYEENALMMELDAQDRAYIQQMLAEKKAREAHVQMEGERSKSNAKWGQSGLAMDGSKELVRQGRKFEDRQREEDELFGAELEEEQTLERGRREANLYRIERGISPRRSTLSLGSSIYKYGR